MTDIMKDKFEIPPQEAEDRNHILLSMAMEMLYKTYITSTEIAELRGRAIQLIEDIDKNLGFDGLIKDFENI